MCATAFLSKVKGLDHGGDFPEIGAGVEVVPADGECGGGFPLVLKVGGRFGHPYVDGGVGMLMGAPGQLAGTCCQG